MAFSDETHVMVDIETTGQTVGHAILSIGAVKFDADGVYTNQSFEKEISLESCCLDYGMKIDDGTVNWIEKQDASFSADGVPLEQALRDLTDWLPDGQYKIWANSPSFDCNFLEDAYRRCGMDSDWNYWEQRDVRTAEEFYYYLTGENSPDPKIEGNDHDPVYDAKKQALSVLMSMREAKNLRQKVTKIKQ